MTMLKCWKCAGFPHQEARGLRPARQQAADMSTAMAVETVEMRVLHQERGARGRRANTGIAMTTKTLEKRALSHLQSAGPEAGAPVQAMRRPRGQDEPASWTQRTCQQNSHRERG